MLIRKRYSKDVRPFGAFDDQKDGFACMVISMDPVDMGINGIRHMNFCDFLLQLQ